MAKAADQLVVVALPSKDGVSVAHLNTGDALAYLNMSIKTLRSILKGPWTPLRGALERARSPRGRSKVTWYYEDLHEAARLLADGNPYGPRKEAS